LKFCPVTNLSSKEMRLKQDDLWKERNAQSGIAPFTGQKLNGIVRFVYPSM